MNQPLFLVMAREVRERVRTFAYRASTAVLAVLAAVAIVGADQLPALLGVDEELEVGLVAGEVARRVGPLIVENAELLDIDVSLTTYASAMEARTALEEGDIYAYLDGSTLVYESEEEPALTAAVSRALYFAQLPETLERLGLTPEQAAPLISPEGAEVNLLEPEDEDIGARRGVAALQAIGLYLALALYGNWILQGVAEEKATRIAEVMLGLVRPAELLAGKTAGILAAAVLQLLATVAGAAAGLSLAGQLDLPSLTVDVGLASAVYLILGLVLYSLLFAMAGATVSRQSEAQSAAMPITFFLLVPYLISVTVLPSRPDSPLVALLSVLPVSSPLIMPGRVAAGDPSVAELALSVGLLLAAIVYAAWLGGRIYSGAMLSGRRLSLFRAVRQALAGQQG